ncbi:MAG: 1-acyl-sn-glycerol-3-phosphate acyltransferase [bacterium]|nr:1-acyl-sn-glycerol-3-phosphate acyltransferase [bacterium]
MGGVRIIVRLVLLVVWTMATYTIRLAGLAASPFSKRLDRFVRRRIFRIWAKVALRLIGVRVRTHGNAPLPPFFSVSNHLTNLDLVLLASVTGCVLVSRADVAQWPVIGFMARTMDTIFVDRSRRRDTVRVNELIGAAMDRGDGVHVFAESRIAQDGEVHPFKPSLLEPAVQMGVPVHYAALSYRVPEGWPPAREVLIWRDGMSFGTNILNILRMPHLDATVVFGDAPIPGTDRKELAEELYQAVAECFVPLDSLPRAAKAVAEGPNV